VETWYQVAALSLGGVLGVNARYWLGVVINRWAGSQFPWATFTINVTGSFAIGLCAAVLARWSPHPHARLVVVVGFLGGYTTFSSYSFESLTLWERGEHGLCLAYMFGSVAAGFAGVVLGTALGRGLTGGSA
jgi:CrcB protein